MTALEDPQLFDLLLSASILQFSSFDLLFHCELLPLLFLKVITNEICNNRVSDRGLLYQLAVSLLFFLQLFDLMYLGYLFWN